MTLKWSFFFIISAIAVAKAQDGYSRDNPTDQLVYNSAPERFATNEELVSGDEIPGEAGKDYPVYGEIPDTRFECGQQQFPGYYADTEARCQVFHICHSSGRKDSFLCPNGTIFNQEKLVCEWWYNFDCAQAQSLYSINEAIVRAMEEADRLAAEKKAAEGYRYNTPSGSRNIQQQGFSSVNLPQPDFDTVVVEAARNAPSARVPQPQRSAYERPAGSADSKRKTSGITGATFRQQQSASRDAESVQELAREYLPAQY